MKTSTAVFCFLVAAAINSRAQARGGFGMGEELQQEQAEVDRWTAAIKKDPKDAEAWFHRGVADENLREGDDKEMDKAVADYSEAIRLNPDYAEAYKKRAAIYWNTSAHEKAMADYTALIRIDPKDSDAYFKRGACYIDLKKEDKALADYNEAIRLNPAFAYAYYSRATMEERSGDTDKAIADYTSAIQLAKPAPADIRDFEDALQPGEIMESRGKAYLKAGDWDKAIADFTTLLKPAPPVDGDDGSDQDYGYDLYICRALAYRGKGDNTSAIADYTAAAKSGDAEQADRDFAHMGRGETYAAMGEKEKALADFEKAVELHPYSEDFITAAIAEYNAGQYDKAIKNCTTGIEECDAGINAYDIRGAAHAAKGETKRAGEDFKQAIETGRESCQENKWKNPDEIDKLAAAEARLGKFAEAGIHQQMALDLAHAAKLDPKLIKAMEDRLALYQQKKPYLEEKDEKRTSPVSGMLPMD